VFTDQDEKNIQDLGAGAKMNKKGLIGKFGIGFNTIYHLTDLPSFVAGNQLYFLDPHAKFVPLAEPTKPGKSYRWHQLTKHIDSNMDHYITYLSGRRYNLASDKIREILTDHLATFSCSEWKFGVGQPMNGNFLCITIAF